METPTSSITSTGDLGGQKVAMDIDSSAMAHIMSILTDLYSDPEMAVIREYSTNALDAHIEAGNKAPIEVFTPNGLNPYFKVVDHGVGLSVDDITNMYSKYGASTKRGTNEQVGMLGLGAKSALTLVPQFNLTSVKNGVRILVSISRDANGAGQMEIIDTRATDEPNGVEISIPIPRSHTFADKCKNFFRFWKQGTVLVNGKEPDFITGRPVGDNFLINRELSDDYVVMGNVAYPVKDGIWTHSYGRMGIVAFISIGDVNFTPSREALHYTAQTKATINYLRRDFEAKLTGSIQKDIDDSASYTEAWKKAKEWKGNFGSQINTLSYKGVTIPNEIPFMTLTGPTTQWGSTPTYTVQNKVYNVGFSGRGGNQGSLNSINPLAVDSYLFITEFADSLKMSPTQREKTATYIKDNNLTMMKVVVFNRPEFITNPDHLKFLDGIKTVKWSEIAKIKLPKVNALGQKIARTEPYDMYAGGSYQQVSVLDKTKPILYYSSAELSYPSWLNGLFPDGQVIMLTANRWEKFKRDWPTALHYKAAVVAKQNEMVAKLTESDKILWHYASYKSSVSGLDASKIIDPDLALFITALQGGFSPVAKQLRDNRHMMAEVETPDNPLTKYPLAGNLYRSNGNQEHLYWYFNAYHSHLTLNKEDANINA